MIKTVTPIIGLEVHVELTTKSKMFCGCPAYHFGKDANTQTCPVCLGLPGALPVANAKAIDDTIQIGLALNCSINEESHFDRKQYFYPDLAKGYQISQYDQPFCYEGYLTLDSGKKVGIERVHLEEDTGKLQHTEIEGVRVSLVDFNRCGVPLVEIVSKPDMNSSDEAKEYLKKIYQLIVTLGASDADMEKGQMRLEPTVNVKITDENGDHYTPLVELKNINSFNFASQAIEYELKRQMEEWEETHREKSGGNKATRGYDSVKKVTFPQREKEEAKDYRYFPEPDIPPFVITKDKVKSLRAQLPELPDQTKAWLVAQGLRADYAVTVIENENLKQIAKRVIEVGGDQGIDINTVFGQMINAKVGWQDRKIEDVVTEIKAMSEKKSLPTEELGKVVEMVIESNQKAVDEYKAGKLNSIQYLLGQVMRSSQGMAKAEEALEMLKEMLG